MPVSENRALVTAGKGYRNLNYILYVDYRFTDQLELSNPQVVKQGDYLRLGHLNGTDIIFSDGWQGPHQPFRRNGSLYYTDDAPAGRIYRDGEILIDHWPGVAEVTNPWVDDFIWFEARDDDRPAPEGWCLYRSDLNGNNVTRLFRGANPCMFKDTLYYGIWNGSAFDIATEDRQSLLPADPYLSA